jgi:hypothetical protein
MDEVVFMDPMNDSYQNPTLVEMERFIFDKGDEFWQVGCAEASLHFSTDLARKSILILAGTTKHGFIVKHEFSGSDSLMYVLVNEAKTDEIVSMVNSAGSVAPFYRRYFAEKEVVWEAVKYFMETGDRNPLLSWEVAEVIEIIE